MFPQHRTGVTASVHLWGWVVSTLSLISSLPMTPSPSHGPSREKWDCYPAASGTGPASRGLTVASCALWQRGRQSRRPGGESTAKHPTHPHRWPKGQGKGRDTSLGDWAQGQEAPCSPSSWLHSFQMELWREVIHYMQLFILPTKQMAFGLGRGWRIKKESHNQRVHPKHFPTRFGNSKSKFKMFLVRKGKVSLFLKLIFFCFLSCSALLDCRIKARLPLFS